MKAILIRPAAISASGNPFRGFGTSISSSLYLKELIRMSASPKPIEAPSAFATVLKRL